MKDYLKQHLTPGAIIVVISIFLYSIGFYIHNNYLAKYRVANFDLIKGKYIYVGLTYIAILCVIILIALADVSFVASRNNFRWKNLFIRVVRFESILLVLYQSFPDKNERLFEEIDINVLGIVRIAERQMVGFLLALATSFLFWFMFSLMAKGHWPEKEGEKFNLMLSAIVFIPTTFIIIWGIDYSPLFKDLFVFVVFVFFMFHSLLLGALIPVSKESLKISLLIKGLNRKASILEDLLLMAVAFVPMFIGAMNNYSNHVYDRMPENFGGAKPIPIKVVCFDSMIIEGQLIDETENNLVVQPNNKTHVIIISRSNIGRAEIELPSRTPEKAR